MTKITMSTTDARRGCVRSRCSLSVTGRQKELRNRKRRGASETLNMFRSVAICLLWAAVAAAQKDAAKATGGMVVVTAVPGASGFDRSLPFDEAFAISIPLPDN